MTRGLGGGWTNSDGSGSGTAGINNFRLTLTSGAPVTTSDVFSGDAIYCSPYNGNQISLYNGTSWELYDSSEFSLPLGTLTSAKLYDVFCYSNAGVPTLEFLVWTNATTRATNLVYQDGVLCKTGDLTMRYIGTFYNPGNKSSTVTITNASPAVITYTSHALPANAPVVFTTTGALPTGITAGVTYYVALIGTIATNTFNISATPGGALINTSTAGSGVHTCTVPTYTEDSVNNRLLFNYYNAVPRSMVYAPTANWNYTSASVDGWYGNAVAAAANRAAKLNFVIGISEIPVAFEATIGRSNSNATDVRSNLAIGIDSFSSLTPLGVSSMTVVSSSLSNIFSSTSFFSGYPAIGFHFCAPVHNSVATGTATWDFSSARFSGVITA